MIITNCLLFTDNYFLISIYGFAITVYCLLITVLFWGWVRKKRVRTLNSQEISFSVIIAAKNEAKNLQRFLPFILQQKYSKYEIIVILDKCTDESEAILKAFQQQYVHLRYLKIESTNEGWASKKFALSEGIYAAKNEYLAFTDADCEVGEEWLSEMAKHFEEEETQLVLGLGMYFEYPSFLNKFIRFETFYTAFQYIGWANVGVPYMGVGRNLGYRKSFFLQNQGFTAFKAQLSGDDDLFVNAYANAQNTRIMTSAKSISFSEPKHTFSEWLHQKFRHVSASSQYSLLTQFVLAAFHFAHIGSYFFGFLALFSPNYRQMIILIFLFRLILGWLVFLFVNYRVKEKNLLYLYPVLDLFYFFYNSIIVPLGLIRKPQWR